MLTNKYSRVLFYSFNDSTTLVGMVSLYKKKDIQLYLKTNTVFSSCKKQLVIFYRKASEKKLMS